jgi:hypothetical protein
MAHPSGLSTALEMLAFDAIDHDAANIFGVNHVLESSPRRIT